MTRTLLAGRALALCTAGLIAAGDAPVRAAGADADDGPIPSDRRTTWDPGIPGGIPAVGAVHATLDARAFGDGVADATAAINAAIQAAGAAASPARRQVVLLPPGTYRITRSIELNRSDVVLRGAGPERTRIRLDSREAIPAVRMGVFWPDYPAPVRVVGSVPRGARTLVVADARGIQVGDVLQLDQLDDPSYVLRGDQNHAKRGPRPTDVNGPSSPGGYRSVGQQVEVASRSGNSLGLSGPTHVAFDAAFAPEVFETATARAGQPGTRYVGLEDLAVTGGNEGSIFLLNVAYGWVRNVESDGDPRTGPGTSGAHLLVVHGYRCEIRGSHVHHARSVEPGGGAYGIVISHQSSGVLVEDNIVRWLNKPIVMVGSGGGNVVAYNYVDDAFIASHASWQESGIDASHGSFAHHDLFEGNRAPNLGGDSTHGNSGWQTFFRNYAPGTNGTVPRTANLRAAGVDGFNRDYTFVGNVLLRPGLVVDGQRPVYLSWSPATLSAAAAFRVGAASLGGPFERFDDGTALRTLLAHGNFDAVTGRVTWDPSRPSRDLPASLFRTSKPAFFGDELWPYVDPLREPRVGVLPAERRLEAMRRRSAPSVTPASAPGRSSARAGPPRTSAP